MAESLTPRGVMDETIRSQLLCSVKDFARPISTALRQDHTVAQAMAQLRETPVEEDVIYFYVTDAEDRLTGVVSTRRLLLAQPAEKLESLMSERIVSLPADKSLEDALHLFAHHRFLALPVVDQEQRLLGAIDLRLYAGESVEVAEAERLADLHQVIGLWVQELNRCNSLQAYARRMPWLGANVLGGAACAAVATIFGDVVEAVLIIAAFIPMVLTLSEAMGIQSLTLAIQSMHHTQIQWKPLIRMAQREWKTSLMMGLSCGLGVGLIALAWAASMNPQATGSATAGAAPTVSLWAIGGVILLSIAAAMFLAAMVGLIVPMLLHAMKLDPKLAAGPLVLMLADSLAMVLYLGLATWWLL